MIKEYYPKVLIVTNFPFNKETPVGLTLTNLFSGWPSDRIAQIHLYDLTTDKQICDKYWCLDCERPNSSFPGHKQLPLMRYLKAKTKALPGLRCAVRFFLNSLRSIFLRYTCRSTVSIQLRDDFWLWVNNFAPDIIYSSLENPAIIKAAYLIVKKLKLPFVPHFFDDWMAGFYYGGANACFVEKFMLYKKVRFLLKHAPTGLAINEDMREEYEKRYHINFQTVTNIADAPEPAEKTSNVNPNRDRRTMILTYAGSLGQNRWKAMKDICKSLANVGSSELNIELHLYLPKSELALYKRMFANEPIIKKILNVSYEILPKVLSDSDILLYLEDFGGKERKYTRFSFSTKIPVYLSSGRPILAYGPAEISSIKYIKNNNCGVVITKQDINLLSSSITYLLSQPELLESMGKNCRRIFEKSHSANTERERFRVILQASSSVNDQMRIRAR